MPKIFAQGHNVEIPAVSVQVVIVAEATLAVTAILVICLLTSCSSLVMINLWQIVIGILIEENAMRLAARNSSKKSKTAEQSLVGYQALLMDTTYA